MTREQITEILAGHVAELKNQFAVTSLSLFGSIARGDSVESSDADFVVEFSGSPTFDQFMELKFALEDWLDCRIDLVTRRAIRPELSQRIESESVRVA